MWIYIIAAIVIVEVLGGLFFYSIARAGHDADERSDSYRRFRIARRKAVKSMKKALRTSSPQNNWRQLQKSFHN